jgi:hypothetical protein
LQAIGATFSDGFLLQAYLLVIEREMLETGLCPHTDYKLPGIGTLEPECDGRVLYSPLISAAVDGLWRGIDLQHTTHQGLAAVECLVLLAGAQFGRCGGCSRHGALLVWYYKGALGSLLKGSNKSGEKDLEEDADFLQILLYDTIQLRILAIYIVKAVS